MMHADQRGSKRKSAEPDPKARQRMQGMFKRAPARAPQRDAVTDQSSEDLLSDILGSIGGDAKYDAVSHTRQYAKYALTALELHARFATSQAGFLCQSNLSEYIVHIVCQQCYQCVSPEHLAG